jgi:hypothetical protein
VYEPDLLSFRQEKPDLLCLGLAGFHARVRVLLWWRGFLVLLDGNSFFKGVF